MVFGRSGAGKSTSSRLALESGWEVLSDDMNALVRDQGDWRVEKLPFAGDLGQTPSRSRLYPIAGLHWLQQAADHAAGPMPASWLWRGCWRAHRSQRGPLSGERCAAQSDGLGREPGGREGSILPATRVSFLFSKRILEGTMPADTSNFRICADVRYQQIADEGVVVRQTAGEVLVLNEVGTRVLALLDEGLAPPRSSPAGGRIRCRHRPPDCRRCRFHGGASAAGVIEEVPRP